jgi:hypothetical protein
MLAAHAGFTSDADDQGEDTRSQQHQHQQNQQARYRGVSLEKRNGAWRARLYCRCNHTTLGRFPNAEQAACSHDQAAVFVMGDRAVTNFGIAAAREGLKLLLADPVTTKRCSFRRLVVLREAVLRDQESQGVPNERRARSLRAAAAAIAFKDAHAPGYGGHLSEELLAAVTLATAGGNNVAACNVRRGGGGGGGGSKSSSNVADDGKLASDFSGRMLGVRSPGWKALLSTAARSSPALPTGSLARAGEASGD